VRWARDLACFMEVGQWGYMGILLLYVMSRLLKLGLEIICTYILKLYMYIQCAILYKIWFL